MLIQSKRPKPKGFLGAAKETTKAPYHHEERTPDMFAYGKQSSFITPVSPEKRAQSTAGIKR